MRKRDLTAARPARTVVQHEAPAEAVSQELNGALSRGLAILQSFRPGDHHLGNSELAERVGLPKATVSRLTQTLADLGFLNYLEAIGKYELTTAVLSLGYAALSRTEIHARARPLLQQLAYDSGVGVGLGVREGLDMVIIEYAQGHYSGGVTSDAVGRRIPIAVTTMGWACVQGLSAAEQLEVFDAIRSAHPNNADQIQARMLEAFHSIHETGFCIGMGEFSPAYNSVGVPLLHPNGSTMLALHLAGPSYYLPREDLINRWGPRLRDVAAKLRGVA